MWIPSDNYVTAEEYRRSCGYACVNTIMQAIKQGRLRAYKFGNTWLIPANAIMLTNRNGLSVGKYKKRNDRRSEIDKEIERQGYSRDEL